jgi:hypothetical protein
MTHRPLLLALVSFLAVPACSNDNGSVDIGRNVGSQLADYAATWDGYAEAYQFDDGSDRIRVTLDASGQGTLVVGDHDPAPLPDLDNPSTNISTVNLGYTLTPGLAYPIEGAHVETKRVRLGINALEPFRPWCSAQTPVCDGENCGCTPDVSCPNDTCIQINAVTGETVMVPFNKDLLCRVYGVCSCTSASCSAGEAGTQLDAALQNGGTELVGTFFLSNRVTVRMTRQ